MSNFGFGRVVDIGPIDESIFGDLGEHSDVKLLSLLPLARDPSKDVVKKIDSLYSRTSFTFTSGADVEPASTVTGQIKVTGEISQPDGKVEIRININVEGITELQFPASEDLAQSQKRLALIGSVYVDQLYDTILEACGKVKKAQITLQIGQQPEIKLGKFGEQDFDITVRERIISEARKIFEPKSGNCSVANAAVDGDTSLGNEAVPTIEAVITSIVPKGINRKTAAIISARLNGTSTKTAARTATEPATPNQRSQKLPIDKKAQSKLTKEKASQLVAGMSDDATFLLDPNIPTLQYDSTGVLIGPKIPQLLPRKIVDPDSKEVLIDVKAYPYPVLTDDGKLKLHFSTEKQVTGNPNKITNKDLRDIRSILFKDEGKARIQRTIEEVAQAIADQMQRPADELATKQIKLQNFTNGRLSVGSDSYWNPVPLYYPGTSIPVPGYKGHPYAALDADDKLVVRYAVTDALEQQVGRVSNQDIKRRREPIHEDAEVIVVSEEPNVIDAHPVGDTEIGDSNIALTEKVADNTTQKNLIWDFKENFFPEDRLYEIFNEIVEDRANTIDKALAETQKNSPGKVIQRDEISRWSDANLITFLMGDSEEPSIIDFRLSGYLGTLRNLVRSKQEVESFLTEARAHIIALQGDVMVWNETANRVPTLIAVAVLDFVNVAPFEEHFRKEADLLRKTLLGQMEHNWTKPTPNDKASKRDDTAVLKWVDPITLKLKSDMVSTLAHIAN